MISYEECKEISKKYSSRNDFCKGNNYAYKISSKNKWLDDFTWLKSKTHLPGYWTYERCKEESRKYTSRNDFCNGSRSAYTRSLKNGWLDEFTWLTGQFRWTKELVDKEAKKYTSQGEFSDKCWCAFALARKEGWLKEYTWFKPKHRTLNYETCKQEASKYKTKAEFKRNDSWAHEVSRRNSWLNEFFPKNKTNENSTNI